MSQKSKIVPLSKINNELSVGGKAKGLSELIECGLKVPDGFVIIPTSSDSNINDLKSYYEQLGQGKVAVRSSALGEDSEEFSHAGQYKTFLNIEGLENVHKAVKNCIESASATRVKKYTENLSQNRMTAVAVVVQKMVEPVISGVIFTLDPTTGEEKILINAIRGEGEALVSGKARADLYVLNREGNLIMQELSEEKPLLSENILQKLVHEALYAEKNLGKPLDMEWAIDKDNQIHWLQARPITTLNQITINELDTPVTNPNNVYTRANVGEMLPGAVTPLSISVFVEAIDIGCRRMYQKVGVYSKTDAGRYICNFYGHLFFNLTKMYEIARSIIGTSKDSFEINLIGRTVPETTIEPPIAFRKRFINSFRYFKFVNGHKRSLEKLEKMAKEFTLNTNLPSEALFEEIDKNIPRLYQAYYEHYVVSANSGMMNGALVGFISGGNNFTEEALAKASSLLMNISQIESANIVTSLEEIAASISQDENRRKEFTEKTPEEALQWLKTANSSQASLLFSKFLERHGHRCIREAEFRENDWRTDPIELIKLLQSLVKNYSKNSATDDLEDDESHLEQIYKELELKGIKKKLFTGIYTKAKAGMQNREYSKSLVIKVHGEFRKAYRKLANQLEEENILPESDLLYFLKHDEIGELIKNKNSKLVSKAQVRKKLFAQQRSLQFPEITFGKPEPILDIQIDTAEIKELKGTPVSQGIVRGKVRVVKSIEDAEQLQPGEIMVASFTDIGWSPYYSLISGLITEIGGSLSHGAIVAREYGLPLVSNISNATRILQTGQEILLNGNKGTVTIIE
ncbi:MAG: PEP/pyruvate-binding domain-containing protein [Candidatus Heimdallarchaeaceae archaeon]